VNADDWRMIAAVAVLTFVTSVMAVIIHHLLWSRWGTGACF
jgi:hypothetical protein